MKSGIYTITNKITNKLYVGSSSKCVNDRISIHLSNLRKNKHPNKHLQAAFNVNGENNFIFEFLIEETPELCIYTEQYWINQLNVCNPKYRYNRCPVAGSNLGLKMTQESKDKMRYKKLGSKWSEEAKINFIPFIKTKEKHHMYGKKCLQQTIDALKIKNSKAILQCDLEGNIIKEWCSIKEASRQLNIGETSIIRRCKGKIKNHSKSKNSNYIWKYKNEQ